MSQAVFVYLRYSSGDRQRKTLELQKKIINEYISNEFKGAKEERVFEDKGYPPETPWQERPGLSSLLTQLKNHPQTTPLSIVALDFSRFARTATVATSIREAIFPSSSRLTTVHLAREKIVINRVNAPLFFSVAVERSTALLRRRKTVDKRKETMSPRLIMFIKQLYARDGVPIPLIVKLVKKEFSGLSITKEQVERLAKVCNWEWGGISQDSSVLDEMRNALKSGCSPTRILKTHKGAMVGGKKLTRARLLSLAGHLPPEQEKVYSFMKESGGTFSIDSLVDALNLKVPRGGGRAWNRQAVWRALKAIKAVKNEKGEE